MNKKYIIVILALLFVYNSHADNHLFYKVQNKLKADKQALSQFQYMGTLHCLDKRLSTKDYELFTQEYIKLYNGLFALPRLITEQNLIKYFDEFEQKKLGKVLPYENSVVIFQKLYSGKFGISLYNEVILSKNTYYQSKNTEYFNDAEFQQYMRDYLKIGKIDAKRFF